MIDFLVTLVLLTAAAASLLWPLRRTASVGAGRDGDAEALEAARDAKLRDIRDLELDFRLGKLSEPDYVAIDSRLRAEAVQLIRDLQSLAERDGSRRPPLEAA